MFGRFGALEILVIAVVVLVLFGRGKISNLMGEIGKGITAFKRGVKDGKDELEAEDARDVTPPAVQGTPVHGAPLHGGVHGVPEKDKV